METTISVHQFERGGTLDNSIYLTTSIDNEVTPISFINNIIVQLPVNISCHVSKLSGKRQLIFTIFLDKSEIRDVQLTSLINTFEFFIKTCIEHYIVLSKFKHLIKDVSGSFKTCLELDKNTKSANKPAEQIEN